ncbi:MAG: sugar phosphate isomerase/epimerase family protein [Acidobacteriota bacterium]
MSHPRFGVSTHLFHDQRLDLSHLQELAAHAFASIELFATRAHFDYHDAHAIERLAGWLSETGLTLDSVHAPIGASLIGGVLEGPLSTAASDETRRRQATSEAEAALALATLIPYRHLVVHLGVPAAFNQQGVDNRPDAARRSIEALLAPAAKVGVTIAIELIPNPLSNADALVRFIEQDLDGAPVGVCLDVGHAFLMGEVAEAVESTAEYLVTTHLHDNHGQSDDHLAPGEGSIDWAAALMAFQKVGYDGTWMFEVANATTPGAALEKMARARSRFTELLDQSFENLTT